MRGRVDRGGVREEYCGACLLSEQSERGRVLMVEVAGIVSVSLNMHPYAAP